MDSADGKNQHTQKVFTLRPWQEQYRLPCESELEKFLKVEAREKTLEILLDLKLNETAVLLVADDGHYRCQTLLRDYSQTLLSIEKPKGYANTANAAFRLYFKDRHNLWNFFESRIIGESKNTLSAAYPSSFSRLQRRKSERLEAPAGTTVFCYHNQIFIFGGHVKDISETGLLIFGAEERDKFDTGTELDEIVVKMPDKKLFRGRKTIQTEYTIIADRGKIVRSYYDKTAGNFYYGIRFKDSGNRFKKALINYFG